MGESLIIAIPESSTSSPTQAQALRSSSNSRAAIMVKMVHDLCPCTGQSERLGTKNKKLLEPQTEKKPGEAGCI